MGQSGHGGFPKFVFAGGVAPYGHVDQSVDDGHFGRGGVQAYKVVSPEIPDGEVKGAHPKGFGGGRSREEEERGAQASSHVTPDHSPKGGPGLANCGATTEHMPKGVGPQPTEETLPRGGGQGDASVTEAVVKGEGVEGNAKLVVPDGRAKGGVNKFTVGFEEVVIIPASRGPKESSYFARKGGVFRGRVPLGPIVLGVDNHGFTEPPAPRRRFVGPREAVQVNLPILVPRGHVLKEVEGGVSFMVLCFH